MTNYSTDRYGCGAAGDGYDWSHAVLPASETRALIALAQQTEDGRYTDAARDAADQLVRHNARLVLDIAQRYRAPGLLLTELVEAGMDGLLTAIRKFDLARPVAFSTYATWWIRQMVVRWLHDRGAVIRVPVHVAEKRNKLRRVAARLALELCREPTIPELAEAAGYPERQVRAILTAPAADTSLDQPAPLAPPSDRPPLLGESVAAPEAVEDTVMRRSMRELVVELLGVLTDRERAIVIGRFALDGGERRTLEQVGAAIGLTRERARQIEKAAMVKLLAEARRRGARAYIAEGLTVVSLAERRETVESSAPAPARASA